MKSKTLSINSDDFGLSPDINRGIIDAFRQGILTDASLMANGPAFDQAVHLARESKLPLAAHINLIRGPMLTCKENYSSVLNLWQKSLTATHLKNIEIEARAQLKKIMATGLQVGQINSEKHSHIFPPLFKLWLKLAEELHVPYIRFIREFNSNLQSQGLKANILSCFSSINRKAMRKSSVKSSDYFCGITVTGRFKEKDFIKILHHLRNGWTELMVHAGYEGPIDPNMGRYFLNRSRQTELELLRNPKIKGIINSLNINLKNFGGIDE